LPIVTPIVRPATLADASSLRHLLVGFTAYADEVDVDVYARRLAERVDDPTWCIVVAEDGDALIGYAVARDHGANLRCTFTTGRLDDLYVAPQQRRGGVGRALVEAVCAWARSRPEPMILDWQATAAAVPFYERLGFEADRVGDLAQYPAFCLDLRDERSASMTGGSGAPTA